jgi:hypothetical protein
MKGYGFYRDNQKGKEKHGKSREPRTTDDHGEKRQEVDDQKRRY